MKICGKAMRMAAFVLTLTVLLTLGMPSGVITAQAREIFHITAKSAAGGGITDEGRHGVKEGNDKTYHIYPDAGHRVNYVVVDGQNIGAVIHLKMLTETMRFMCILFPVQHLIKMS